MLNPLPCLSRVSSRVLRNVMKILDDLHDSSSKVRENLRVSALYLQFPAFSCIVVCETCAFTRQEWLNPIWWDMAVEIGGRCCGNCGEIMVCFSTRLGTEQPLSFSATFYRSVMFRIKMEGREAAKHRNEDHVSQVHARCQLVSKR